MAARPTAGAADDLADLPTLSEQGGIRYLHFDSEWIQGAMRTARPNELVLAYTRQMMAWLLFLTPAAGEQVGILGLGAGSLLRFTLAHTPATVHTVERNPLVTAMCRAFFRLPGPTRSVIDHADAEAWIAEPTRIDAYCALMVDLYDAQAQGPVCDSLDFYVHCRQALADGGIMTVNLFGNHQSFGRNMDHIREAFDGRVICLPEVDEGNIVAMAFKGPVRRHSVAGLLDHAHTLEASSSLPFVSWARAILDQSAAGERHVRI